MPIANANVNLPSFHSSSEIAITKMEIQQRRLKWATRLEEVLNDFDGLQLFQSWMGVDEDSSEHPLRLHFAIVAYREMLAKADPRAVQLAREIYNKFLRARSGLCAFIEPAVRERVGQRLRQHTSGSCPPAELFDECLPPLDTFLRRQHALFVSSHEFLDKLNAGFCPPDSGPSCSSVQNTPAHSSRRQQLRPTALTADTLLRSQREREAMVPTGTASQRLFKPVSRFPYVGQAQPSKNDSAVSSSFSSEANRARGGGGGAGGSYSLRMVRDEQKRINPQLMATFPRLDHGSAIRVETSQSANQFRHDSDEGRHQFAEQLQRKLQTLQLRHRQEESVKEQIERINSARQKGTKQSARELIAASAAGANDSLLALGMDDSAAGADADEELETYYRQKMATGQDSNSSAANSAGQTPPLVPLSRRTRRRSSRGDNGSCSPLALDRMHPLTFDWAGPASFAKAGPPPAAMSQSCCSGQPGSSATAASGWGAHFGGGHFPLLESTERAFFIAPVSGQHQQQPPPFAATFGGFGHPQQQQAIPAPNFCLGQPTPMATATTPRPTVGLLSQSLHLAGTSAIPQQSKMATQPPPFIASKCQNNPTNCDNDGDTSGIGSMTSATHSGTSAPGTAEQRERQRAAVFRKARLSAGSGATSAAAGTGGGCSQQQSAIPRQQQQQPKRPPDQQQFDSLIRPRAALPPQQPQLQAQQGQGGTMMKMAISYRDNGADGVPVMAQIPLRPLTFREFRRILSISSKDHRQFFFKTASEDGSAPYQLLLVNDDSAILPMFCGKIVAECRAPLSDSD